MKIYTCLYILGVHCKPIIDFGGLWHEKDSKLLLIITLGVCECLT